MNTPIDRLSGWSVLSRKALSSFASASFTYRHFGISCQTFYRWWRRYDAHDLTALEGLRVGRTVADCARGRLILGHPSKPELTISA